MALIITVKVVPASGRNQWVIDKSGALKCFLKSPAEQGKANKELIKICLQKIKKNYYFFIVILYQCAADYLGWNRCSHFYRIIL